MSFKINNGYIQPSQQLEVTGQNHKKLQKPHSFQEILEKQMESSDKNIKVSSHANKRLAQRDIHLNDKDLKTLSDAMDKLGKKGARESLMLYKDIAFIGSIRNRTLITAMDPKDSKENIFTNIDSALIVE